MTMIHTTEHTIVFKGDKGAYAKTDVVLSYEGVKGLGYQLSPSVNQELHPEATLKAIQILCSCTVGAHITPVEAVHVVWQRVIPKRN
jgi:hypothetical protein